MFSQFDGKGFPVEGIMMDARQFSEALPIVADAIEFMYHAGLKNIVYGFMIYLGYEDNIKRVITRMLKNMPPHVQFYEADGRHVFQVRGPSGGVASKLAVYLYTKE